jgi:hypothetical protein
MGRRTSNGDRHSIRLGVTVYGKPDQSSGYAPIVKCQYSQVSSTHGRDKRDFHGPDGTA